MVLCLPTTGRRGEVPHPVLMGGGGYSLPSPTSQERWRYAPSGADGGTPCQLMGYPPWCGLTHKLKILPSPILRVLAVIILDIILFVCKYLRKYSEFTNFSWPLCTEQINIEYIPKSTKFWCFLQRQPVKLYSLVISPFSRIKEPKFHCNLFSRIFSILY